MSKKKEVRSFEDLEVWKKAKALRKKISLLTKSFPTEEKYRLVDQMIRCSRSVTANIAEGYGRFHYQENIQFCRQARGSLYELLDHTICAKEENYLQSQTFEDIKDDLINCIRILNGYISYLQRAKNSNEANDPQFPYSTSDNK